MLWLDFNFQIPKFSNLLQHGLEKALHVFPGSSVRSIIGDGQLEFFSQCGCFGIGKSMVRARVFDESIMGANGIHGFLECFPIFFRNKLISLSLANENLPLNKTLS
jgi:hypothetical protein